MFKIEKINESLCKRIQSFHLTDSNDRKIFVDFDIIDTHNTDPEYIDKLGIIRGDVHTLCNGIIRHCCVITGWSEEFDVECMELLSDYLSYHIDVIEQYQDRYDSLKIQKESPYKSINTVNPTVFFIFDKEYKGTKLKDAFALSGKLVELGFQTADCISDFENNFMLISADYKICQQIFNNYFKRNQFKF